MTFYEVEHLDESLDPKDLGFFSTLEKAEAAVAQRSKEPGFRDYPGLFLIVKREKPSAENKDAEGLYEASIYAHTADLESEYIHRIGFFTDLASANEATEWAKRHSHGAIPGVETEYIVWKLVLDQPHWEGGFERY